MNNVSKDLIGASSIPIVLSILKRGDSYGFEIAQYIKEATKGKITFGEASIYPVLKKLEKKKMIKSYWKIDEDTRPRRYYKLLKAGEKQLHKSIYEWEDFHSALKVLWNPVT